MSNGDTARAYRVVWEIDVYADSPRTAARQALAIQRDPDSVATVFSVTDGEGRTTVCDLNEEEPPP